MKASSLTLVAVLCLAGTACSQPQDSADAPAPLQQISQVTTVSAPADDGFNLRIPGDTGTAPATDDGFNLPAPNFRPDPADDGFNLPTSPPGSNGLNAVPEIAAPAIAEDTAADDDDIIRLEP